MTKEKDIKKNYSEPELLPLEDQPLQLNLFFNISESNNSQSLRLWDSLVNAIFDDRKVVNRVNGKFLETTSTQIEFETQEIEVIRYPARIGKGNEEKEHFPMKKEYKVLEALIKLAVDDTGTEFYGSEGAPDYAKILTIKTTLYKLHNVFKSVTGKATYSYTQLEEALEILSKSHISFKHKNIEVNGPLISSYSKDRNSDIKNTEFVVSFHTIISRIVLHDGYREFNLKRSLNSPDMFTTFLYKKFVHNFKQASKSNHYHFSMVNLLKEAPNLNNWKEITRKIVKVNESLGKLKGDVVSKWEYERHYSSGSGAKKTTDCIFNVWFTDKFISEQIKANQSNKDALVIDMQGKVIAYPDRRDYEDNNEYVKDLKKYHSSIKDKDSAGIVKKIFI